MKARDQWKLIQAACGTVQDGIPGPNDQNALARLQGAAKANLEWKPGTNRVITKPGFAFSVEVDGDDLVVRDTRCTCFGGTNDPQDSGETASGISTKDPSVIGCALPRDYNGPSAGVRKALQGSPIPEKLPFKTLVEVDNGITIARVPFIDIGPAKHTGNGLDLTVAAAKLFKSSATATNFAMICTYRILGGAKYL